MKNIQIIVWHKGNYKDVPYLDEIVFDENFNKVSYIDDEGIEHWIDYKGHFIKPPKKWCRIL